MIRLLLLIGLLALPFAARAEVARVNSGEHADFSRLVVTLDTPSDWQFGRTEGGYALSFLRQGISFDTDGIFGRIPRTRIGAVRQDGQTSRLLVMAGCECHATAFEFRPGIIVVDMRNGPPESSSPFERPVAQRQGAATYDPPLGRQGDVRLADRDMLRDGLLRELSVGAARGVVDMALAPGTPRPAGVAEWVGLQVGAEAGFESRQGGGDAAVPDARCTPDAALAIEGWGGQGDPLHQLAQARRALATELDQPKSVEAVQAARMLIHLGFGAEAQQVIHGMAPDLPDRALLLALADLVDGEADPSGFFARMERCDTSAALWAVLSRDRLRPSEPVAAAAATRAFAALPLHLRQHLSMPLVQRFIEQGDAETAQRIRNALAWSTGADDPAVRFIAATLAEDGKAAAMAEIVDRDRTREPDALIALVDAHFQQRTPVVPGLVTEVAAVSHSLPANGAKSGAMIRALALAQALGTDFEAAFRTAALLPQTRADIWGLLGQIGPDSALLQHAVLGPGAQRPSLEDAVGLQLATRLAALGFPVEAGRWLKNHQNASPVIRLSLAELAVQDRDLPAAASKLAGLQGKEAAQLRARIAIKAGRFGEAADLFKAEGLLQDELQARRLARQWSYLAKADEGIWQAAAQLLHQPETGMQHGLSLASARALLGESGDARAVIAQLSEVSRVDPAVED